MSSYANAVKAVIRLVVPDYQIGEPVTVFFKDTMQDYGVCEKDDIVRCKDCIHRGKSEKCVLAAISEEKDFPLFMLDNRGEWFCADGELR